MSRRYEPFSTASGTFPDAVLRFGRDHAADTFYGFMFDCNADYGQVLLCLNTEAALADWAERHYPSYTRRDIEARLRWNAGDWTYQGFNEAPPYLNAWEEAWASTQDEIEAAGLEDDGDGIPERFLESVCRVLVRMERNAAFDSLTRDPGFKTLVADHDEALEDSWARLLRIRKRAG